MQGLLIFIWFEDIMDVDFVICKSAYDKSAGLSSGTY